MCRALKTWAYPCKEPGDVQELQKLLGSPQEKGEVVQSVFRVAGRCKWLLRPLSEGCLRLSAPDNVIHRLRSPASAYGDSVFVPKFLMIPFEVTVPCPDSQEVSELDRKS